MSVSSNNKKAVALVVDEPNPLAASEDPWKGLVSSTNIYRYILKILFLLYIFHSIGTSCGVGRSIDVR